MEAIICLVIVGVIVLGGFISHRKGTQDLRDSSTLKVPVKYTKHVQERMLQRGVSQSQIEAVLMAPDRAVNDRIESSVRLEKNYGSTVLKVWVVAPWPATGEIVVKSAARQYQERISIPTGAAAHIIGRKGTRIKELSCRTSAQFSVTDREVRITAGSAHLLRAAMEELATVLDSIEARVG